MMSYGPIRNSSFGSFFFNRQGSNMGIMMKQAQEKVKPKRKMAIGESIFLFPVLNSEGGRNRL